MQQYVLHMSSHIANFVPLAAEIGLRVSELHSTTFARWCSSNWCRNSKVCG